MRRTAGFTLIELMIVVVIIAILASIALPSYQDYVVRGKITEATANLGSLRVNMEQYYQDNRKYDNGSPTCGVAMPTRDIKYFTFTCSTSTASGAGDQQYSILATGNATGGMNGFVYSIDQSNNKATTIASPVDTNAWGTGDATCWVIRKKSC